MNIILSDNYKNEIKFTKDNNKFSKVYKKKLWVYNAPASFDIETTSTYDDNGNKIAFMYLWGFEINNNRYIGRTWEQFIYLIDKLVEYYNLGEERRIMVYVHNLAFEFGFIKNLFNWIDTFSLDNIRVIRAISDKGVGFGCSLALSNYSLADLAKNLTSHKIKKLVGDLDYSLIRHSKTEITNEEMNYLYNDIDIVYYYIEEMIEQFGSINKIPMTNTGKVRKDLQKRCLQETWKNGTIHKNYKYKTLMKNLTVEPDEYYKFLKPAFMGGYTHCNAVVSREILDDVASWDETSAYPYIMLGFKFPMSKGKYMRITCEDDLKFIQSKCYVVRVRIDNLVSKYTEDYLSLSKVNVLDDSDTVVNNGRIHRCKSLFTTVTDVDINIIQKAYNCEIHYGDCYYYEKAYLPRELKMAILDYYGAKTSLKGVEDSVVEYLVKKGMLNSIYGMSVCSLDKQLILYDSESMEFNSDNKDVNKLIADSNKNRNRTVFYPWGVWTTAYNRARLWSLMMHIMDESNNMDFCYADTDSVKIKNPDKYRDYIMKINGYTRNRLEEVSRVQKIPFELFEPMTIKGKKKLIGEWDFEGIYTKAKFIRAKTYITMKEYDCGFNKKHCPVEYINKSVTFTDDKVQVYEMTIAGCNKDGGMKYLIKEYGKDLWNKFDDGMFIPEEYSGRLTHTYINNEVKGKIEDYNGIVNDYEEASCVHLEPASYTLGITGEYINFCFGIKSIIRQ